MFISGVREKDPYLVVAPEALHMIPSSASGPVSPSSFSSSSTPVAGGEVRERLNLSWVSNSCKGFKLDIAVADLGFLLRWRKAHQWMFGVFGLGFLDLGFFAVVYLSFYLLCHHFQRGRLFARKEIRSIEVVHGGLFFIGDGTGLVMVWKCLEETKVAACS